MQVLVRVSEPHCSSDHRKPTLLLPEHRGEAVAFVWRHMIAAPYLFRYIFGRNRLHLEHLEYGKWAMTANRRR